MKKIGIEGWIIIFVCFLLGNAFGEAIRRTNTDKTFVHRCEEAGGHAIVVSSWANGRSPRFCLDQNSIIEIDGTRMQHGR
jgi:hypothetical protein